MYRLTLNGQPLAELKTIGHVLAWLSPYYGDNAGKLVNHAKDVDLYRGQELIAVGLRFRHGHAAPDLDHLVHQHNDSPYELFVSWVREVEPVVRSLSSQVKPYELPAADWQALTVIGAAAYGVSPALSSELLGAGYGVAGKVDDFFYRTFGWGHNGPLYDGRQQNSRHDVHVQYALLRGDHVPDDVVQYYVQRTEGPRPDSRGWFRAMLRVPYLRGRFRNADEAHHAFALLADKFPATEEKFNELLADIHELPPSATAVQMEDLLYARAWLDARALPSTAVAAPAAADTKFGRLVYSEVIAMRLRDGMKAIQERRDRGQISLRDYEYEVKMLHRQIDGEAPTWANHVAKAVESKDLAEMLKILDCPGNEASHRACEAAFKVKLRNVPAAVRRRTVFELAGIVGDEAISAAERRIAEQRRDRAEQRRQEMLPQRIASAKMTASGYRVRINGAVVAADKYVEDSVAAGFTEIASRAQGAAQRRYMYNPETRSMRSLRLSDGSLQYAELLKEERACQANA